MLHILMKSSGLASWIEEILRWIGRYRQKECRIIFRLRCKTMESQISAHQKQCRIGICKDIFQVIRNLSQFLVNRLKFPFYWPNLFIGTLQPLIRGFLRLHQGFQAPLRIYQFFLKPGSLLRFAFDAFLLTRGWLPTHWVPRVALYPALMYRYFMLVSW